MKSILITNSLANDMVQPISKHDSLPHILHIGHYETQRLLGDDWKNGPLIKFLEECENTSPNKLGIMHVRDWHDENDPHQRQELALYGKHCMENTDGARFIWEKEDLLGKGINKPYILNSRSLLAASEPEFDQMLEQIIQGAPKDDIRIGIAGVLTDMKVLQMAISLKNYFHFNNIAVCSALSASNIRRRHFDALDSMEHQYGINVIGSISQFSDYLSMDEHRPISIKTTTVAPEIKSDFAIDEKKRRVIEYLYKECKSVSLDKIAGGFSGSQVFMAQGEQSGGIIQVPMILKLDSREMIAKERMGFEKVQYVLGPHVPSIESYYESDDGAGIRYSFAMMNKSDKPVTFKRFFMNLDGSKKEDMDLLAQSLELLSEEIITPTASCYEIEPTQLYQANTFCKKYAVRTVENINNILGKAAEGDTIMIAGTRLYNPARFYTAENIEAKLKEPHAYVRKSLAQGDLNAANILIDSKLNQWILDFFHTDYGWHNIQDIVKLENDLKYIHTPLDSESDLKQALEFETLLLSQKNLSDKLPELPGHIASNPNIVRAYTAVKFLRELAFAVSADDDMRHYRIPQLRYSAHNLEFEESSDLQKEWALAGTAMLCGYLDKK